MNTIPTAEEFLLSRLNETQPDSNRPPTPKEVTSWLIELARLHAIEVLKSAWKEFKGGVDEDMEEVMLNAYSLDNIK